MPHRFAPARPLGWVALTIVVGVLVALTFAGTPPVLVLGLGLVVGLVAGYLIPSPRPQSPAAAVPDDRDRLIAKLRDELNQFSAHGVRVREERLRLLESAVVHANDAVVILESEPR